LAADNGRAWLSAGQGSEFVVHFPLGSGRSFGGCCEIPMNAKLNMIYWRSESFWLGKLLEHPDIMTQGETLEELEENLKDAYMLMAMDDVPEQFEVKEISL
jgi:predicted RNase H-like HicB family nuclease